MDKFEYKVKLVKITNIPENMLEDEDALTELGEQGWELVSVVALPFKPFSRPDTRRGLAYLKRIKKCDAN